MILKLGMQCQGLRLYKVCINDDPGLTLTCFATKSNLVPFAFGWVILLQSHVMVQQLTKLTEDFCE